MAGNYGWKLWLGVREAWACRRAPVRANATLHLHGRAQERAQCVCERGVAGSAGRVARRCVSHW